MLEYSEAVAEAIVKGQPVVALESTIIVHGMPFPQNLETAHLLETTVRERGAVPATIAVLEGKIRIGLDPASLEKLARAQNVAKVSRRDLPVVLARGGDGATTVAATMICAARAGIQVFATGGLGGVHWDGHNTMDVSADLTELAQTNVAVVCAGAKAVLDLGRTLEVLETLGVPVIGYQTDAFPAFYIRDSGFPVPARLDDPDQIAQMLQTKWDLDLKGGAVIANPIPPEHAMNAGEMNAAVEQSLQEAAQQGITGKEITPFLLDRMQQHTQGRSLAANIALAKNNAALAADIAVCMKRNLP
ncbi:MAG: pseudouridine-5'-phosphate glycosidase [Acidobacteriota bacterium]|nr:pseudouridine-5'-phosphate glycosidase [Acidobacteriota bacterium]